MVLFPAPFGPRNPKISPDSIFRVISSTALKSPNDFVSEFISIEFIRNRVLGIII